MSPTSAVVELFRAVQSTHNVTYVLSADLRVVRWNDAWTTFARANGGGDMLARWKQHTPLLDVVPEVLRPFYKDGFARAASSKERWEHDYECSSPELFRRFRMITYPCAESFVVTHSLLVESPHAVGVDAYEDNAIITMCSHCRRVQRSDETGEQWDWIPAYVAAMPSNVSHGLCGACAGYYYPDTQ